MALGLVLSAGLACAAAASAQERGFSPQILEAVVKIKAQVPPEARTAAFLGTEREGSGVVIDGGGLILTIGYLITEAMSVEVTGPGGKPVLASVVGFDNETGLGLVRAAEALPVRPIPFGRSEELKERDTVLVASFGGIDAAQPAFVVSRRTFAGYWEYLLDNAIFTAPPHLNWGGAALIGADGKLLGIGSLIVRDALSGAESLPGNMFVPIEALRPVLPDLIALGKPGTPPKPWLGVNSEEIRGRIVVTRVSKDGPADKAGIAPGDLIVAVAGQPVKDLAEFYRQIWAVGEAGVTVPLTVLKDNELKEFAVKSINRYSYLKLNVTY